MVVVVARAAATVTGTGAIVVVVVLMLVLVVVLVLAGIMAALTVRTGLIVGCGNTRELNDRVGDGARIGGDDGDGGTTDGVAPGGGIEIGPRGG
jgi:hypothetical protein